MQWPQDDSRQKLCNQATHSDTKITITTSSFRLTPHYAPSCFPASLALAAAYRTLDIWRNGPLISLATNQLTRHPRKGVREVKDIEEIDVQYGLSGVYDIHRRNRGYVE